ncbi:MAG: hypothetical protein II362_01670, partial [Alistipes sp.]|nr:hypothetical protein [Alistipes sp.]
VDVQTAEEQMAEAVETMLENYPATTLQDLYKSCFQDHFGVAHLLADRERVKGYIAYELSSAEQFHEAYWEPCGWQGNFVRANLKVVRDGLVTVDELTDAFMASAAFSSNEVTDEWIAEWNTILRTLQREGVDDRLPDFTADSTRIAQMLEAGHYVVHHSEPYGEAHHPHYRIIHRSIFEERILPKLPR